MVCVHAEAQVFALGGIIEPKGKSAAVFVFIDFKRAFNSINHQTMFMICEAYGVFPKLLKAVKFCY